MQSSVIHCLPVPVSRVVLLIARRTRQCARKHNRHHTRQAHCESNQRERHDRQRPERLVGLGADWRHRGENDDADDHPGAQETTDAVVDALHHRELGIAIGALVGRRERKRHLSLAVEERAERCDDAHADDERRPDNEPESEADVGVVGALELVGAVGERDAANDEHGDGERASNEAKDAKEVKREARACDQLRLSALAGVLGVEVAFATLQTLLRVRRRRGRRNARVAGGVLVVVLARRRTQAQNEVQRRLGRDAGVGHRRLIAQLTPGEHDSLLVGRNARLVLHALLQLRDRQRLVHRNCVRVACQRFHKHIVLDDGGLCRRRGAR